ncbi:MAG: LysR family transcriptional regulator [Clostridium fessum]
MELRQLSYFTTIVNEGNISQAAKKLNISQPPLSHQMKLLEAELGVTLFERGSRRIRLTPAGKTFYDRALAILDLSQAARTELTAQKQEIQGVVRLGIISSAVEFVTRHYLAPFRRSYPKALFELHESNSYHLLDLLHSNQIDLAVIRTPFAKAGLEMQTLPPEAFHGDRARNDLEPLPGMPECPSDRHSSIQHWFCDSKFPPYACIRRFRTTKKPYAHISSPLCPHPRAAHPLPPLATADSGIF